MNLGLSIGLGMPTTSEQTPAPVLTSLNYSLADTAGGDSITITGTDLASASSCTVGVTSATITANTSTSLTFTMPAKAAGTYDVVVTTAGGASNALSIEAWSPAELSLTGWWKAPYTGSPWTPSASAGSSGSNGNLAEATNPPTATSGYADFDGTNDKLTGANRSTFAPQTGGSVILLAYVDTAAADGPLPYNLPGLAGDSYGLCLSFSTAGFRPGFYDGAWKTMTVTASTGVWLACQVKWNGTTAYARVNDGAWSSVACGNVQNNNSALLVGAQFTAAPNTNFSDSRIREVLTASSALSDALFSKVVAYFGAKYGALG